MESNKLINMLSARNNLGDNFFHEACRANSIALLQRAAEWMDDKDPKTLNQRNYNGEQCTHIIVKCKEYYVTNMMEIVIFLGADINGKEGLGGRTPLHLCVQEKNYQLAESICGTLGVNLEAQNYARQTAYYLDHLAYKKCDYKMMEILKKAGAKCDPPSSSDSDSDDDESNDPQEDETDKLHTNTLSDLSSAVKKLDI